MEVTEASEPEGSGEQSAAAPPGAARPPPAADAAPAPEATPAKEPCQAFALRHFFSLRSAERFYYCSESGSTGRASFQKYEIFSNDPKIYVEHLATLGRTQLETISNYIYKHRREGREVFSLEI